MDDAHVRASGRASAIFGSADQLFSDPGAKLSRRCQVTKAIRWPPASAASPRYGNATGSLFRRSSIRHSTATTVLPVTKIRCAGTYSFSMFFCESSMDAKSR
jgi:hypothetical protein